MKSHTEKIRLLIDEFPWLEKFLEKRELAKGLTARVSMINHDLMLRQQEYYFQYGYFAYWETILLIDGSGELLGYVGYEPKRRKKIRWWTKLLEWVGYSDQSMFINDELVGQAILRTGSASKVRFILAMSDMEVIVYRSHLDIPAWLSSHQFATK